HISPRVLQCLSESWAGHEFGLRKSGAAGQFKNMFPDDQSVCYVDNHLLVINKPGGIPSQADATQEPDVQSLCKDWIKARYQKPGAVFLALVQRLDRNTSGLMVLARTSKAAARLSAALREHQLQKTYLAVVEGNVQNSHGRFTDTLWKDPLERKAVAVGKGRAGARQAIMDYRVLARREQLTLVAVQLHTGRFHQIRCQAALHLGPLAGDRKYGSSLRLPDHRLALHCWRLELEHPVQRERMQWQAELPAWWQQFWPQLWRDALDWPEKIFATHTPP
ncbi:MAG: RluA family pseudouridine synthase, partial [Leptospiraceae bacterium]|nr:RluA family pseudouridine synthase [Leptospiraceae bacterium]